MKTPSTDVSLRCRYVGLKRFALLWLLLAALGSGGIALGAKTETVVPPTQTDFHYGLTPQALLSLRWLTGTRLSLDATGRTFHITDQFANRAPGTEQIDRLDTSVLLRLFGGHPVSVGYAHVERSAHYEVLPSLNQRIGTVSVMYSYVSDVNLGRVKNDD